MSEEQQVRHVCGISGGKDSAALAVYMRDRVPEMEYFFCDTGKELPETYDYLARLEAYLGKPIERLNADRDFDHWLKVYGDYLPSPQMRWCTRQLKIRPFEKWIGESNVISYIAIRADEGNRSGYVSTKDNISAQFPFKEDGVIKDDVFRILEESGVGVPKYYEWRTRSGCFFCFYQRKAEWIGLKERHPELYEKAKKYEKEGPPGEPGFTWSQEESLDDLEDPVRMEEIKRQYKAALEREANSKSNRRLIEVFEEILDDEDDSFGCSMCHL
jgi:hypothetical protein